MLDTGVLLAALDPTDRAHDACAELIAGTTESLIVPAPVLVELRKVATLDRRGFTVLRTPSGESLTLLP